LGLYKVGNGPLKKNLFKKRNENLGKNGCPNVGSSRMFISVWGGDGCVSGREGGAALLRLPTGFSR
jgi:hypothetical protein